jgi:hypothetical protein
MQKPSPKAFGQILNHIKSDWRSGTPKKSFRNYIKSRRKWRIWLWFKLNERLLFGRISKKLEWGIHWLSNQRNRWRKGSNLIRKTVSRYIGRINHGWGKPAKLLLTYRSKSSVYIFFIKKAISNYINFSMILIW